MRLPPSSLTRQQLLRSLAAIAASGSLSQPRAALAAYNIVPIGTVAGKQQKLREVEKAYAKTPDDPYVFGEKAQLEYDIAALQRNRDFAAGLNRDVADGKAVWAQGLTVSVPDMAEAVAFWTGGLGALVLDTRIVNGANVTRVGYGPQSLRAEDGAKFALELIEARGSGAAASAQSALQYIQLAVPVFRASKVLEFGGEFQSSYGWADILAPGGLAVRVHVQETRRDAFEFIALRTSDLKSAVGFYESLGMTKASETTSRRKLSVTQYSRTLFENADASEPEREAGSVLMSYGETDLTTGLLLLPPKSKNAKVDIGARAPSLRLVGAPPAGAAGTSPDGLASVFTPAADFEAAVGKGRAR